MKTANGWKTVTIEECCEILDSRRIPVNGEDRDKRIGDIPYYGANGIQGYIDDFIFDEALILIAEDGGCFDEFATRPIAYRVKEKSWVNNHAHVLRAKKEFCQDIIFYALEHKDIQSFIVGGTRSKLNQSALRSIVVDLPVSKPEQTKIAEILSTVDRAIEQTEALIAKQQRIKTGLMQDLLTRGIDEHDNLRTEQTHKFKDSPLGRIPVEWKCGVTGEFTRSLVPGRDKPDIDGGSIPWITIPDIDEMYIRTAKSGLSLSRKAIKAANARLMPRGTVLMSCVGEFGIAAIADIDLVANQQLHGFICDETILPFWLVIQIIGIGQHIDRMSTQTTIKYLNKTGCESIMIAVPDKDEQERSITLLSRVLDLLTEQRMLLTKFQSLKTALMQDLLTGRKRVTALLDDIGVTN